MLEKIRSTPRKLLYSIITGLAIRLALAPFTAHPFDMYVFYSISNAIVGGGTVTSTNTGYIPMEYYTLLPISYLYSYLSGIFGVHPQAISSMPTILQSAASWTIPQGTSVPFSTDWLYNLLEKIPLIISDLLGAVVLYRIVLPIYGERAASYSFIFWFLNPMLIWVSAVWGMFDSLPALFTLLATFFLLKGNFYFAAFSLSIATGYKLYPILLAIPLFVYAYRSAGSMRRIALPVALFAAVDLALFLPGISQLFSATNQYLASSIGNPSVEPWQTFGLTYWSIASLTPIAGSVVKSVGSSAFVILALLANVMAIFKLRKGNYGDLFFWELVSLSAVFLGYRIVAEQWFIWILPFLVILFVAKGIRKEFLLALTFIALLYSWTNSLFVAFFLPISNYDAWVLEELARGTLSLARYRLDIMAVLGSLFTFFFVIAIFSVNVELRARRSSVSALADQGVTLSPESIRLSTSDCPIKTQASSN